jgi:endonuclease YncB( thermonuclease family)
VIVIKIFLNLFFVLGVFTNVALADQLNGFCNKVVDANTLLVNANGKEYTVTLAYIIAPEPGQKFGAQAKQFVEKLALYQNLRIQPMNTKSGTTITAEVYSPKKGDSINYLLAQNGFAWAANDGRERNPNELGFAFAKKHKLGVWSDSTLTPPIQKTEATTRKHLN